MTRERWAVEFSRTARAHWTEARTLELTGGKQLAVVPGDAPVLLRALGLIDRDATMPSSRVHKFLQINHLVRVIQPAIDELCARHRVVRILDAGCGRSYLSLLVAWCARERWHHRVEVLGVDRDAAVIEQCRRRCALAELDDVVEFRAANLDELARDATGCPTGEAGRVPSPGVLASLVDATGGAASRPTGEAGRVPSPGLVDATGGAAPRPTGEAGRVRTPGLLASFVDRAHAVFALHACDTATDDAIVLGVRFAAELIAVAPCCQAELARGWSELASDGAFAPIWRAPHLRRETAAHLTDAMRMLVLRASGYRVTATEFIAAEHTKKNTLIRATMSAAGPDHSARLEYDALVAATGGVGLGLSARLGLG